MPSAKGYKCHSAVAVVFTCTVDMKHAENVSVEKVVIIVIRKSLFWVFAVLCMQICKAMHPKMAVITLVHVPSSLVQFL